ncbi:MAG TPA: hypothetical protein VLJ68_03125, partial [Chitinophagaceae bacterium]|nr:hypothetical protein [Chitinophagaceae bacterium]
GLWNRNSIGNQQSAIVNRKLLSWWVTGLLPALLLIAAWFYWIIIHPVSDVTAANLGTVKPSTVFGNQQSAFQQLLNRSWWGLIRDPAIQTVMLLKRVAKTLLEYSPVIMLLLYNRYFNKNKKESPAGESLNPLIKIHSITAILYLAILPLMFAPHEHQIPLFALLATLILARELTRLTFPWIAGLIIVIFQLLIFFFVIPRIHKVDNALKTLDKKIVSIMKPGGETPKALLLLHSGHPDHVGLLAETHSHIYTGASLNKFKWDEAGMDSSFRAQLAIFPEELRKITDSTHLWILTTDKKICSMKFSGFQMETNHLNDSVCLLHLQRIPPNQ